MTKTVGTCKDCGREMISRWAYRKSAVLRAQYVAHVAHRLCTACHTRAVVHGTLPDPAPRDLPRRPQRRRAEVLADYRVLRRRGHTKKECAEILGMTVSALDRALCRAKAAGERVPA